MTPDRTLFGAHTLLALLRSQLAHLRAAVDDNEVEREHLKQVGVGLRARKGARRRGRLDVPPPRARHAQEIVTIKEECDALKAKGTPKGRLSSMVGGRF